MIAYNIRHLYDVALSMFPKKHHPLSVFRERKQEVLRLLSDAATGDQERFNETVPDLSMVSSYNTDSGHTWAIATTMAKYRGYTHQEALLIATLTQLFAYVDNFVVRREPADYLFELMEEDILDNYEGRYTDIMTAILLFGTNGSLFEFMDENDRRRINYFDFPKMTSAIRARHNNWRFDSLTQQSVAAIIRSGITLKELQKQLPDSLVRSVKSVLLIWDDL